MRDAAVTILAYLSGTRRAELVAQHLGDLDTEPAPSGWRATAECSGRTLCPTVGSLLKAWMGWRPARPALLRHRPQGQPPSRPHRHR